MGGRAMAAPEPATDHYEVLGLSPEASERDIKRAYKKLALKFHPDRRPGPTAEAVLRRLNEAYAVLRDPKQREHYDWLLRQRRAAEGPRASPPSPRPAPFTVDPRAPSTHHSAPPVAAERWRGEGRRRRAYARATATQVQREGRSRVTRHVEAMRDLEASFEAERSPRPPGRRRLVISLVVLAILLALLLWLRR